LARFFSGSVFPVPGLKNQNRTEPVGFFKILIGLIGFFLWFGFFGYFFSGFLGLIGFSVFLNTPSQDWMKAMDELEAQKAIDQDMTYYIGKTKY